MPLLTVFAALFGYLLVTIHDTEFYGDDNQPSQVAAATVSQSVVPTAAVSEEAKIRRAHFENRNSNSAGPSTLSHQISTIYMKPQDVLRIFKTILYWLCAVCAAVLKSSFSLCQMLHL